MHWFVRHLIYFDLHTAAMFSSTCEAFALQIHPTRFVGHSFRVEGETWYFFANSSLYILILSQIYFCVVMQVELLE